MKYRLLYVAILAIAITLGACSEGNKENVDLVDGVPGRWDELHERAAQTLVALRNMTDQEQRQAYLEKEWPTLENDIVAQLQMADRLVVNHVDSVVFHFGSGQGVQADDRTGNMNDGFFSNELVAYVYVAEVPIKVLVRCLNGLFVVDGSELRLDRVFMKEPTMRFTIDRRRGLTSYVDYATSVNLAERFRLPMYRGRIQTPGHKITPAQARALADSTDKVFVAVKVFEGDEFDLGTMTYKPFNKGVTRPR